MSSIPKLFRIYTGSITSTAIATMSEQSDGGYILKIYDEEHFKVLFLNYTKKQGEYIIKNINDAEKVSDYIFIRTWTERRVLIDRSNDGLIDGIIYDTELDEFMEFIWTDYFEYSWNSCCLICDYMCENIKNQCKEYYPEFEKELKFYSERQRSIRDICKLYKYFMNNFK